MPEVGTATWASTITENLTVPRLSIVMPNILSREFLEQLHERMYGDVWFGWALNALSTPTSV
jgi:fido (protein-threonine AMPylation protein)